MADRLALAAGTPAPLTVKQRAKFLAYVRQHTDCSVREAAEHAGVKRLQIRYLKRTDEEFAAEYREARGYGDDKIRDEVRRRAIEGVVEPVFGALGEGGGTGIVGHKRVYSDRLLALMAKAHLPEYRDRVEHTGLDGGPMEVNNPDVAAAIERFGATVRRLAERAQSSRTVRAPEPEAAELAPGETGNGSRLQR